jgi:hypothetical protein
MLWRGGRCRGASFGRVSGGPRMGRLGVLIGGVVFWGAAARTGAGSTHGELAGRAGGHAPERRSGGVDGSSLPATLSGCGSGRRSGYPYGAAVV